MNFLYWFLAIWAGCLALPFALISLHWLVSWAGWIVVRPFRGRYRDLVGEFGEWVENKLPGWK